MRILRLIAAGFLLCASALIVDGVRSQGGSPTMSTPGAHLMLLLDVAEVRASWLSSMRDEIRRRLREAKVGFGGLAVADNVVRVRLAKPEDADAALKALVDLAPAVPAGILDQVLGLMRGSATSDVAVAKGGGGTIIITPTEAGLERRMNAALDNAVVIAGRRLDGMGVAATAVRQGRDRIHVHAPALQDTSALKELLTKPARFGFHEVISAEEARQGRVPVGFKAILRRRVRRCCCARSLSSEGTTSPMRRPPSTSAPTSPSSRSASTTPARASSPGTRPRT
jgi:preprotein translocase subunit SecD